MADEVIELKLTAREVDVVCNALAQRPWVEVNAVLQKIVSQMNQRQAVEPAPAIEAG